MTQTQWEALVEVVNGKRLDKPLCGFIVDSPWLPGWSGEASVLDYYASEAAWLDINLKACRTFPSAVFLPGFWSEYGMCTEPSAFGSRLIWHENELPFAEPVGQSPEQALRLAEPRLWAPGGQPVWSWLCPVAAYG
ncbi:MAG: uroporphyrinogen decarboxylase, partial [Kiritimatiellaeota bacterium]|nr:uroporphyrinogen decarboxylase [Kiritimatiellota bacterium]